MLEPKKAVLVELQRARCKCEFALSALWLLIALALVNLLWMLDTHQIERAKVC